MEMTTIGNKTKKYVIIHGHFYQPPRENPWLGFIERQPSATPHNDWNERIYDQCYRPNAYSRLLDGNGMITGICNNYKTMSFNYGPTLFRWLEKHHPKTAQQIIQADKESCRETGEGNAIAQVYNHIIMPLALRRDQITQIRWAKHYFHSKFGRQPKGIWLAETAINMETVTCLIDEKIRFAILAPSQAESFREMVDGASWQSTENQSIDTRRAYRVYPSNSAGNRLKGYLDVFFFDEGLSKEISFGAMLNDANHFGDRIAACYDENAVHEQAVVIATDGETFGHHKPFGDMCLAYFFNHIAPKHGIVPVNFASYLEKVPPRFEVRLRNAYGEGTAWSCAHGVGRWIRDCGCKTGGEASWRQAWRTPLRTALENLQNRIDGIYESKCLEYGADPWVLRNEYIKIIDIASLKSTKRFLEKIIKKALDTPTVREFHRLLEAQKFMLFSFTSCGWFFTDISGIETIQNLAYACRALQLGIPEDKRESALNELLGELEKAKSNLPETNGRTLFKKYIRPMYHHQQLLVFTIVAQKVLSRRKATVIREYDYKFIVKPLFNLQYDPGTCRGFSVSLENPKTGEEGVWIALTFHNNNADIQGWVRRGAEFPADCSDPLQWMRDNDAYKFTLNDLFYSAKERLSGYLLDHIARDTDARFYNWMQKNRFALDTLSRFKIELPLYCTAPMGYVLNKQWNRAIKRLETDAVADSIFGELLEITKIAEQFDVTLNYRDSAKILEDLIIRDLVKLYQNLDGDLCDRIRHMLTMVDTFSIPVTKNKIEDIFYPLLKEKVWELYLEVENGNKDESIFDESHLSQKRVLLRRLISFAHRMNFNTTDFKVEVPEEMEAATETC